MKTIIFLSILLLNQSALAKAFFPVEKPGATTNYWDKSTCETKEGFTCYDVDLCPLDECVISGGLLIVDVSKKAVKDAAIVAEQAAKDKAIVDAAALDASIKDKLAKKVKTIDDVQIVLELMAKKMGL